ncbi:dolichol kinase [Paramarasmius palmivorus]|uniref:Dolichol kinase n=1 Tax=Paramarasmius palmivorus TaxID=297713 RepID=A0AAW0CXS8_9AGAR
MDWSTSYQAGSSGSQSEDSLDDSDDEIPPITPRGRTFSQSSARTAIANGKRSKATTSSSRRRPSPYHTSSGESSAANGRIPFTRSKSPMASQSTSRFLALGSQFRTPLLDRHRTLLTGWRHVLPATFEMGTRIPFTSCTWTFSLDSRRAGESVLLLYSLVYASSKIWEDSDFQSPHFSSRSYNLWLLTVLYMLWAHISLTSNVPPAPSEPPDISPTVPVRRSASPRVPEGREQRRNPASYLTRKKSEFGFIWMTVPKNYRNSADDGICTGLLFGPLVSCALLYGSLSSDPRANPLPSEWQIEPPAVLKNSRGSFTALEALILSRYNAVDLSVMCSSILLLHVVCSWWLESRCSGMNAVDGERRSVPRSEGRRLFYYVWFTVGVSLLMTCLKFAFQQCSLGFWTHLTWMEVAISSLFYQLTLYGAVRLAHRGFTLGEVGMVCYGGTALFMEMLNITRAQVGVILVSLDSAQIDQNLDLAINNTLHQNISPANTPSGVPDCASRGFFSYRIHACPLSRPVSSYRSETDQTPPLP